jgi:mono/diheme cytochrome c family protein
MKGHHSIWILTAILLSAGTVSGWAQAPPATDPAQMDAATLYSVACARCHGTDGSGLEPDNPIYQNFAAPPADLTDPLFNSREPAADWFLVIKHGGARLGLSSQMPAFGEALSDEQISDLVDHLKGLAETERYPPGDLNFLRPIETIKAFPEDEALLINRYADGDERPDSFRTTLYYARRFGARYQGEAKLAHLNEDGQSELEELELGFKWAVRDNLEKLSLLTVGIEAAFPIEDDLASNEIIPYFSFAKGLSDAFTLQGTLKTKLPTDDPGEGEAEFSAIVHWMRSQWPRTFFPALEWILSSPFEDANLESTLIPQLYFGLTKGGHVALAIGVELPLTDDLDYDYRIHSFLLWDIADGPFWKGW